MTTFASRTEWLAARSKPAPDGGPMMGASDVATPFGLGFTSPARAAAILRGDLPRDPEPDAPSDPRAVGTRLEHVALAEYCVHHVDKRVAFVDADITRIHHPDRPWLAVSPDARVFDGAYMIGLVEVKIPRSAAALGEYAPDMPDGYSLAATLADPRGPAIPRRYALQVLAQMATIRACQAHDHGPGYAPALTYCDLWVWAGPHAHRRVRLTWDDGAQAAADALFDAVGAWRQRHVLGAEPVPVGCPDDAAVAVRLWRAEGQHSAPGLARTAAQYAAAAEDMKRAEAHKEAAKAALLGALYRAGAATALIPDPHADPGAKTKAAREGRPAKVAITGTPGGVRSLRVSPGWIADATWAHLADDIAAPIEPITIPGITTGELAARWADAPAAPATDTPQAADPILAAALAAMAADDGADW
jgi:hypothetical protein